jgi:hypothetical protein
MGKKILIITGAGASKSLTHSLPEKDKVAYIGVGNFRELPTGAELIQQIVTYQDKSVVWLIAYFCYSYCKKDINSDKFLYFAYKIEKMKNTYNIATKTANENYDGNYEQIFQNKINEAKSITKEWAVKAQNLNNSSILIGNDDEKHLAVLLDSSQFLKELVDNLSNNTSKYISFDASFIDEIFLWLIFYIFCDNVIFNRITFVIDNELLDSLFEYIYTQIKEISRQISGLFSDGVRQGYNNPHRFNNNGMIIRNSIYESREVAYNLVIEGIEKIFNYPQSTLKELTNDISAFLEELNKFKVKLDKIITLEPLISPTFTEHAIEIGQARSANEFNGLFEINIINETKREHNITSAIIKRVKDCITVLDDKLTELKNIKTPDIFENDLLRIINTIIKELQSNGFKSEMNNHLNKLILKAKELFNKINTLLHTLIFKYFPQNQINNKSEELIIKDYMKGCYLAASIISHYHPHSIDYFMMNIRNVAPFEFTDIKNDNKKITIRVQEIHKYTKLIIADILMGNLSYVYHSTDAKNNYLRTLLWRLLEYSNFYEISLSDFLLKFVTVINFNYELSLAIMLFDYLPSADVNKFISKNMQHMYGVLYLDVMGGERPNIYDRQERIYLCIQNGIWEALFKLDNSGNYLQITSPHMSVPKKVLCKDLLSQISERIKWIGENKNNELVDRESLQRSILEAHEIFFLGFGFDMNNLYNLGIINKQHKFEYDKYQQQNHLKKIFISGGNAKIIITIKNIFGIKEQEIVEGVYHLKNSDYNLEFFISLKHLPEALSTDL